MPLNSVLLVLFSGNTSNPSKRSFQEYAIRSISLKFRVERGWGPSVFLELLKTIWDFNCFKFLLSHYEYSISLHWRSNLFWAYRNFAGLSPSSSRFQFKIHFYKLIFWKLLYFSKMLAFWLAYFVQNCLASWISHDSVAEINKRDRI